jgi:hypothetical protein
MGLNDCYIVSGYLSVVMMPVFIDLHILYESLLQCEAPSRRTLRPAARAARGNLPDRPSRQAHSHHLTVTA